MRRRDLQDTGTGRRRGILAMHIGPGIGLGRSMRTGVTEAASTSADVSTASMSKPYEIVERAGGWDVVPEGVPYGVKGSETEKDREVDVGDGIPDDSTRIACGARRGGVRASGRSCRSRCARPRCAKGGRRMCPFRRTVRREWTRARRRHPFRRRRWMSMWMTRWTPSLSTQTRAYLLHQRVSSSPRPHRLHVFAPHSRHRRRLESLQVPRPARASCASASCRRTPALSARVRLGFPLAVACEPSPAPESESEDELSIAPRVLGEEEAASVPAEYGAAPAPTEQAESTVTLQPSLPAWGTGSASAVSLSPEAPPPMPLAREPSPPPAPAPVAKVSFKEWQVRRKLEKQVKEVEVAQEREREKVWEQERERGLSVHAVDLSHQTLSTLYSLISFFSSLSLEPTCCALTKIIPKL
ncbi:hypothetical protein B0H17DRAFT_511419 [Mycena rosella]|uniref:Uncharacterized protein n=1 Tax=Mycena rosella TaxID=1033263 RepID=A0AAD7FRN4_MYCRO|nr:hypothetical protein B0H17DRAFT_511419 [Mycena rosella]